jgi:hypothetical protein
LRHLHGHGTTAGWPSGMLDFTAFNQLVGLPEMRAAEEHDLAFARRLVGDSNHD